MSATPRKPSRSAPPEKGGFFCEDDGAIWSFCRPRSASLKKKNTFLLLTDCSLGPGASFNLSCPLNSDKEVARTVDWHHTQIRQQKHSAKVWTVYHYFTTCLRCLHFWQNRGNEPCFCNRGLMARGSFLSLPHNTKEELKLKCL